MKRYLVTGGAGFIGSHLVDSLLGRGDSVRILDNLSTGKPDNIASGAEFVEGDILDSPRLDACLADVDGCFHLAAVSTVHGTADVLRRAHEVNLGGSVNLVDTLVRRSAAAAAVPLVFASSAAVYGDTDAVPVGESAACRPLSAYGADKVAAEEYAQAAWDRSGMPSRCLRLFNVYGPRQDPTSLYSGVINIFLDRLAAGAPVEIYGDGNQVRDFVYVDDVIVHFLAAMESLTAGSEVFNVCTGRGTSINLLYALMQELLGTARAPSYKAGRSGDIRISIGDPSAAAARFSVRARIGLREGLQSLVRSRGAHRTDAGSEQAKAGE